MAEILNDKYEVLKLIGRGGVGKVYLARDLHLQRLVVIKESRKEYLLTEMELLKELRHPGLPLIYDCFRRTENCSEENSLPESSPQEGTLRESSFRESSFRESSFLVMEYIEGMSLREYLDKYGKAPEKQALKWAMEICTILEYLHGRHPAVIYRDLKPENIMIRQDGAIKLIDFGGALQYACGKDREAMCVGTAGYSPRQQWQQTKGDVTWDIYGMGAVLHEMLTGVSPCRPPYKKRSVLEYDRSLSGVWDKIICTCTAQEPAGRYQSVGRLMQELQKLERSRRKELKEGLSWKNLILSVSCGYTALCFSLPLIEGIPETSFPFPYLEKPLFSLMITLLLTLFLYGSGRKRRVLRRQEKNIWLTEKKFSGLLSLLLLLAGPAWAWGKPLDMAARAYAKEEAQSLWVEMRDDQGRKLLLKEGAVYVTDDRVRFELPAQRLPDQELALRFVAVGEDGITYSSRVFLIKGETQKDKN